MLIDLTNKPFDEITALGRDYFKTRRLAIAEECFIEALKQAEVFGENDLRLASSLNNLAALYHSQGKYAFAEEHYKRALKVHENVHGADHQEVAPVLMNLALVYCVKSRYDEAEALFLKAIAIKESHFGSNAQELISVLTNYARMLEREGRKEEAEKLDQRVAEIKALAS